MSSNSIPLCVTSDFVCLADESHISILAAASLRQVAVINTSGGAKSSSATTAADTAAAAAIVAVYADPKTSAVTAIDMDGIVTTRQPAQHQQFSKNALTASASSSATLIRNPHLLTASSVHRKRFPDADVSVVAAHMTANAGADAASSLLGGSGMPATSAFFTPADNLMLGKQASLLTGYGDSRGADSSSAASGETLLTVAALLSDGTVVHGPLSSVRPVPAIGLVPPAAGSRASLKFAASPSLPLAVVAQYGSNILSVFYREAPPTLAAIAQQQHGENDVVDGDSAPSGAKNKASKKARASTSDGQHSDESAADAGASLPPPLFATAPVNIASVAVHPSRRAVALGGTRGEIVVIHDILAFCGRPANRGGNTSFFSDHWHHTPLTALCYAGGPDGPMLLSAASEGCICVWNVGSNYARTNISLGTGAIVSDGVARVSAIQLAVDAPSRCVVCIGEGDVQLAAIDLSHRRMITRRDGLTAGGSSFSTSASSSSSSSSSAAAGATLLTAPVQWMAGAEVTALFLYSRRSGRIRLYDPFERRSLRTSVLTATVETVPQPPTVGLQRVASTANGRRVAVFESSEEAVMPPALRWLTYDNTGARRFRQVQQAIDPHSGETALSGIVWVQDNTSAAGEQQQQQQQRVALITCSAKRIKVWMTMEDSVSIKRTSSSASTINKKRRRGDEDSVQQQKTSSEEGDDDSKTMNCVSDIVLQNHPVLSLIGAIQCAALSADGSVLYVAGDLVAAIDAKHWFKSSSSGSNGSNAKKISNNEPLAVVIAAPSQANLGLVHTLVPTSDGGVAAAYNDAVALFGVSAGAFRCRAVIHASSPQQHLQQQQNAASKSSVYALSSSSSASTVSPFVIALYQHEQQDAKSNNSNTDNKNNSSSSSRYEVVLIDSSRCEIVARSPWHRHYAPASSASFVLLSSVDALSLPSADEAASWRCSVGVATLQRGFRTLSVLFFAGSSDKTKTTHQQQKFVSVAPAATSAVATGAHERLTLQQQEQVSSFFKHVEDGDDAISKRGAAASPYAVNSVAGSERSLFASCTERVLIAKSAARYGTEVLGATTFFATPSMAVVAASVFDRLESRE